MGQSVSVISGTALFLLRRVPGYRNMSAPNQKLVAMLCTVRHCCSFAPHCQYMTLISLLHYAQLWLTIVLVGIVCAFTFDGIDTVRDGMYVNVASGNPRLTDSLMNHTHKTLALLLLYDRYFAVVTATTIGE